MATLSSGQSALDTLKQKFPSMKDKLFLEELDITNDDSVNKFAEVIKTKYGKIDILVNNAAVAAKNDLPNTEGTFEDASKTIDTNYTSTVKISEKLVPLLREDGKIIQISSILGQLERQGPEIRKILSNPDLDRQTLEKMVKKFLDSVKNKTTKEAGFSYSAYNVSKALLNAYSKRVLRKLLKPTQQLYYYNPGWCKTDMGGPNAVRDPKEGVDGISWLIELPFVRNYKLDSKFIFDREVNVD